MKNTKRSRDLNRIKNHKTRQESNFLTVKQSSELNLQRIYQINRKIPAKENLKKNNRNHTYKQRNEQKKVPPDSSEEMKI